MDAFISALIVVALFVVFLRIGRKKGVVHPVLQDRSWEDHPPNEKMFGITGQVCSKPGFYRLTEDPAQGTYLHKGEIFPPVVSIDRTPESATWELVAPEKAIHLPSGPHSHLR